MWFSLFTISELISRINSDTDHENNVVQLFETTTREHIGIIITITETIDTNNKLSPIFSVELLKLQNENQVLLVSAGDNFGLQIYQKQSNNNDNKSKHVLKNTLQFEDTSIYTNNSTMTTHKYIFVKQ